MTIKDFKKNIFNRIQYNNEVIKELQNRNKEYLNMKELHSDIDDETTIKYLKVTLHNIRKTKATEERKENRAKRLSLKPNFDKWSQCDVSKY